MDDNFDPDGNNEYHECVVVLDSNAVIDPRAMMVEPLNALVADRAVAGPGGLDHLALGAEVCWVDVPQELKERSTLFWHDDSWILARSVKERQEYDYRRYCTRKQDPVSKIIQRGLNDEQA
jgi:hypothetical protein